MNLYLWARKWGLPPEAVDELYQTLRAEATPPPAQVGEPTTETTLTKAVRLLAAQKGVTLWRNNVGAMQDEHGNFVRYGLANDSKAMNKNIKSSDLVGFRPLTVRQEHVGTKIAQFVALELKAPSWSYGGTAREQAQLKFLQLVAAAGGWAQFLNNLEQAKDL